jgi:hypothetical protein
MTSVTGTREISPVLKIKRAVDPAKVNRTVVLCRSSCGCGANYGNSASYFTATCALWCGRNLQWGGASAMEIGIFINL